MYDVKLPSRQLPEFPERCHACGRPEPDTERLLPTGRTLPIVELLVPFPVPLGRSRFRAVPYCCACLSSERRHTILQWVLGFPIFFGAMFAGIFVAKSIVSTGLWIVIAMACTILFSTPLWIWIAKKSPAVRAQASSDDVTWTFESPYAAARFARANDAEWESRFNVEPW